MGWRLIGSIRGYTSIDHQVINESPESVTIKTTVCWIPNYETGYEKVCSSSIASASLATTSSFAQNYLAEIASNRGFSRAVREFLRVPVLGFDEINPDGNKQEKEKFEPTKPHGLLKQKLEERGKTFEKFKIEWTKAGHPDAKNWESIDDIPLEEVWKIFDAIKKKESK